MADLDSYKSTIVRSFSSAPRWSPSWVDGLAEQLFPTPPRPRRLADVTRSVEMALAPGYPWELVRSLELTDGATLRLRPIHPDDEHRLVELFHRLSPRTVYQRFFRTYDRLPKHWYRQFANVDYRTRLALIAEDQGALGSLRAVARYEPGEAPGTTEIAIVVEDGWQGRGLGPLLLDALLAAAEARGLCRFTADVLADNRPMLRVLSQVADVRRRELDSGVLTIEFERRHGGDTATFLPVSASANPNGR
jgi:RimJ/RimL family protein N-acetyltransferase